MASISKSVIKKEKFGPNGHEKEKKKYAVKRRRKEFENKKDEEREKLLIHNNFITYSLRDFIRII